MEQPYDGHELEAILNSLVHHTVSPTRFSESELNEKMSNPNPIRSKYSVGQYYIPSELFTIPIEYDIPKVKEFHANNKSFQTIVPSGTVLKGFIVAEYDDNGILTLEGYAHPEYELVRFNATGNIKSATIVRIPTLFDNIPNLREEVSLYPINNGHDSHNIKLSQLALSRVNPKTYAPNAAIIKGLEHSLKNHILMLKGDDGKPVYDGAKGMFIKD